MPTQKPCLDMSYKVTYLITHKNKKPHTIGETLVKPCALEMVELVCGKEKLEKFKQVPLSYDVIHSCIADMSENFLNQVIAELEASMFSMQLHESTDVANCSHLLLFLPLLTTIKGADVFEMLKQFFRRQRFNWQEHLGTLCTDATLENKSGYAALVKKETPDTEVINCFLCRHALGFQDTPFIPEVYISDCYASN